MSIYVTMNDKFMSGWGESKGRINKLVLVCSDYSEAERVFNHAKSRGDMSFINIRSTRPYYSSARYYVQFKTREDMPNWYKGE